MALFFLLAGLILIVTGVNNTTARAGELIRKDFSGQGNFLTWLAAIVLIGAIGYNEKLRPISYALLLLLFVVLLLTSGSGVFDRLTQTLKQFSIDGIGTPVAPSNKKGGSFFGINVPLLGKSEEDYAEDTTINAAAVYFGLPPPR